MYELLTALTYNNYMHEHPEHKKLRVGILFGGKSAEHEVSINSAKSVYDALDKERFEPVLVGIDKSGKWHLESGANAISAESSSPLTLLPGSESGQLVGHDASDTGFDVVFPVLHGPMGEDGTIQGFLELANLPYVGAGVLGSAVGMDKDVMKRLLRDAGLKVAPFHTYTTATRANIDLSAIFADLGTPVFVKPSNMGSSVGISRAGNEDELRQAIDLAFQFDNKVIVETALQGDEIECAVLGNDQLEASGLCRIVPKGDDFYDYESKYQDDGADLEIPANVSDEIVVKAQEVAKRAFAVLDCAGMARVDMFATPDGEIYVNEINTIPGFTSRSVYPMLWQHAGMSYPELISKLIDLAIERHDQRKQLKTSYLDTTS